MLNMHAVASAAGGTLATGLRLFGHSLGTAGRRGGGVLYSSAANWLSAGTCRGMSMTKAAKERRELAKTVLAGEMREAGEVGQFGKRGEFGKRESMKLREEGWVPGRIQTRTGEVLGVKLGYADIQKIAFNRYLKNTLYTVNIQGLEPIRCLVRELQIDPVQDEILTHINLLKYEPEHKQQVIVEVPINVLNADKSPGVKKGGMLNVVMPKIKVVCSSIVIPRVLDLDISELDVGQRIFLRDFKMPAGFALAPIDHYKRAALVTLQRTRVSMGKA